MYALADDCSGLVDFSAYKPRACYNYYEVYAACYYYNGVYAVCNYYYGVYAACCYNYYGVYA